MPATHCPAPAAEPPPSRLCHHQGSSNSSRRQKQLNLFVVPERQTQAKENQKSQEESSGCSFSGSPLLLCHTKQELWQGLNLQPAEFGGTRRIRARWRVGGGWRISSS